MLGGDSQLHFSLHHIYWDGFAYGDTYANADMKDGLLMKIRQC
jgi:hypothetical protein